MLTTTIGLDDCKNERIAVPAGQTGKFPEAFIPAAISPTVEQAPQGPVQNEQRHDP